MKSSDIILQLYSALPEKTDKFSVFADVDSITSVGALATVTTSAPHNLTSGNTITVCGTKKQTPILSIDRAGTVLTIATSADHDLTLGHQITIELSGANEAEFNGEFVLLNVLNRRVFTLTTTDSGAIAGTGGMVLLEETGYGYNGLHIITTTGLNTLTYPLGKDIGGLDAHNADRVAVGHRVSAAASIERALSAYTKQTKDELWAFVVLGAVTASKNRHIENDSLEFSLPGAETRQKLTHPVSIYTIASSKEDILGRVARDEMEDICRFLVGSICGISFDNGWATKDQVRLVLIGHAVYEYNVSYYVHRFMFQTSSEIIQEDTAEKPFSVAFRDISLVGENDLGIQQFTAEINLDDVPL